MVLGWFAKTRLRISVILRKVAMIKLLSIKFTNILCIKSITQFLCVMKSVIKLEINRRLNDGIERVKG